MPDDAGGFDATQTTDSPDALDALEQEAPEQPDDQPEQPSDWLTSLGDPAIAEWAKGKNFKSLEEALRSARETDSYRGRQDQELAETRRQLAEYQNYLQQLTRPQYGGQAQNAPPAQQQPTIEQVAQWANEGQLDVGDAIAYALQLQQQQFSEVLDQRLGQFHEQAVAPIGAVAQEQQLRREISELHAKFPADFPPLANEAVRLFQGGGYSTLSDAFARARMDADAERLMAERRSAQAQTLEGGGRARRGQQQPDLAKLLREELMANGRSDSGGFG